MAGMSFEATRKRWVIKFVGLNKRRFSLTMKATRARDKGRGKAAVIVNHLDELIQSRRNGTALPREVFAWINELPESTHSKLVAAGLAEVRDIKTDSPTQLKQLLDRWFEDRSSQKKSTRLVWGHAKRNLLDFFGTDKPLAEITEADAQRFERWLKDDQALAESTIRKRCGFAKQMLQSAVDDRILPVNPLQALKVAAVGNPKTQFFVSLADSQKVLEACPDSEWRCAFVLARWGALRIPSEIHELKWEDVLWSQNRFLVHAPKTEHHDNSGDRIVPLFPEIKMALDELWNTAEDGAVYVLPRLRELTNMNPQLGRIIKRAGVKVWPKKWQNLRATRATELEREFPTHVVTKWCGHTERIAKEHYWMTTEEDFKHASTWGHSGDINPSCGQIGDSKASQMAASENPAQEKTPVFPGSAKHDDDLRRLRLEDNGLEPMTFWLPARRSPN